MQAFAGCVLKRYGALALSTSTGQPTLRKATLQRIGGVIWRECYTSCAKLNYVADSTAAAGKRDRVTARLITSLPLGKILREGVSGPVSTLVLVASGRFFYGPLDMFSRTDPLCSRSLNCFSLRHIDRLFLPGKFYWVISSIATDRPIPSRVFEE